MSSSIFSSDLSAAPAEIVGSTTPSRVLTALCAPLAIVALLNAGAISVLHHRQVNHGYQIIDAKWKLLERQRKPVDWLVLGDSSGNQGVVPDVLMDRLGGTALNLCTVGGLLAVNDAWMLESYIRRAGPPPHVVIVHAYDVWSREPNVDAVAQVPLPLGFWTKLSPKLDLGPGAWSRILLDRYAPLYSQDQSLSRLVLSPVRTLRRGFDLDDRGFFRSTKALPDEVRTDAAIHLRFVQRNTFALSAANRAALESIAEMARQNGIEIYIVNGPIYEGLYREPSFRTYFADLLAALDRFAENEHEFHVLVGDPITFSAEEMTNADHLIYEAALRYTKFVASSIASTQMAASLGGAPRPDAGAGGLAPPARATADGR